MTVNSSIRGLSNPITHDVLKIYRNVDLGIIKIHNKSSHGILINGKPLKVVLLP
jgi:hypothetical protein